MFYCAIIYVWRLYLNNFICSYDIFIFYRDFYFILKTKNYIISLYKVFEFFPSVQFSLNVIRKEYYQCIFMDIKKIYF